MPLSAHPVESQHEVLVLITQNEPCKFYNRFMGILCCGEISPREHEGSSGSNHSVIGNGKTPGQVYGRRSLSGQ